MIAGLRRLLRAPARLVRGEPTAGLTSNPAPDLRPRRRRRGSSSDAEHRIEAARRRLKATIPPRED